MAQCPEQRGVRPQLGIEKMQRLEIAHQMLKKVGLEGAEKRYIWQLSGGQRQRVCGCSRAGGKSPAVITRRNRLKVLDAFTQAPDANPAAETLAGRMGKQVLLITHDIEEAGVYGD